MRKLQRENIMVLLIHLLGGGVCLSGTFGMYAEEQHMNTLLLMKKIFEILVPFFVRFFFKVCLFCCFYSFVEVSSANGF